MPLNETLPRKFSVYATGVDTCELSGAGVQVPWRDMLETV